MRHVASPMTRRSRCQTALALAVVGLLLMPGCYRRVVDARGIGGDSEKLREQQEREPLLRDALTTSRERDKKPASGVW